MIHIKQAKTCGPLKKKKKKKKYLGITLNSLEQPS